MQAIGCLVTDQQLNGVTHQVAGKLHDVTPESIMLTNGGDELLRLLITTYVEPGGLVGMADPSYSLYPVLATIQVWSTSSPPSPILHSCTFPHVRRSHRCCLHEAPNIPFDIPRYVEPS